MARAPRIEVRHGIYHVVARGNERRAIYRDHADRESFLEILALTSERYRAILVQADEHLLSAVRYILRNPLRAGMCEHVEEWPWSSHGATIGSRAPGFLASGLLLSYLHESRARARRLYVALVEGEAA